MKRDKENLDLNQVWNTATQNIPELIEKIKK